MGNDDPQNSINGLRERQLIAADGLIARCQQLCERVLADSGDRADASVVQLQHDCVQWSGIWYAQPVLEQECVPDPIIPIDRMNGKDPHV